jgi:hypothetical protein
LHSWMIREAIASLRGTAFAKQGRCFVSLYTRI